MRLGFFGEVGFDEEFGGLLLFRGEGFEVSDALELLGGEGYPRAWAKIVNFSS
ncbi:hypothetical protein Hsar01_00510 [Haloferula sargassicola]|uniref:Uncharacterized protein n=1 Tax=Haloferula sargassicola TaxID=490096 RepID=A0ABP9UI20_9BACT